MLNPKRISWTAPTENEDGSPIEAELEYEVGLLMGDEYEPIVTIPGQLRGDERYEAPISHFGLGYGEQQIALRAFVKGQPELKSDWSEPVNFTLAPIPKPPASLRLS